jgi:hypothetical protein
MIKFQQSIAQKFNVNVMNYLTISAFTLNMFLNASGDNMFEKSYYDLSFNRSKIEKQMCKLISAQHVNALLGTTFEHVELYKTNVKFDKYNIDIVFKADNKMYILEVDGVYWHGLILQ